MARVLIIDDSAVVREMLREILSDDPDLEVVGAAPDPIVARDMIKALSPDVLTLDIEMPRMDGIDFLGRLMRLRPMPVVMVSSHVQPGATLTIRALEMGAVDIVGKPAPGSNKSLIDLGPEIISKVKAASLVSFDHLVAEKRLLAASPVLPVLSPYRADCVIGIGASTGGVQAINQVLPQLPADCPPILVVQHMPAGFTRSFAERLDRGAAINVREAEDGMVLAPGNAYVAPGGYHLELVRTGISLKCRLSEGDDTDRHTPSVNVLFRSIASVAKNAGIGVILTGMGSDGASGLLEMRQAGAATACQDEATSMIYGMPKSAAQLGAAEFQLPLHRVAEFITRHSSRSTTRRTRSMAATA